jgi:hypothetical protein
MTVRWILLPGVRFGEAVKLGSVWENVVMNGGDGQRWRARYLAGDRAEVWHEMRQLGAGLSQIERAEALLVCDEMARRARRNIEVLVERLERQGYRFHLNDDDETPADPFLPAGAAASEQAGWLQDTFGAVPMTLLSWLTSVGDVWLVGSHPHWPGATAADPLVVELEGSRYPASPIRAYFADEWEMWQRAKNERVDEIGLFVLPMSPDRLHKDNTSGGPPFGVVLPDGCVDGLWVGDTTMPFVSYLNSVFSNGGFPGPYSEGAWPVRRALAEGLLQL